MTLLKRYVVFLSLLATVLTCDLSQTQEEIEAKAALEANITARQADINQRYRQLYHVSPPVGWMNDPNGFVYYDGLYHLFYQFCPYAANNNGPLHWGHVTSPDLINWTRRPTALLPGQEYVFSGSAIVKDGTLVLIYTGHIPSTSGSASEAQYLAFSNDGIIFNKYKNNPVIPSSPNGSPDFRDPKIWEYGGYYYVVLGSKTDDGNRGRVLLYKSADLGTWEYVSVIGESASNTTMGYMWECPDFFELGGKYILLMSPQGITAVGDRYHNLFQTGYIIGSFSYVTNNFTQEVEFQEIDYGHDFYATQTTLQDGKRYLVGWLGMWESNFTEAADGWAGSLTIIRELTLNGSRILMKPVEAITDLRQLPAVHDGELLQNGNITLNKTGELIVSANLTQNIELQIGSEDVALITIRWNATTSIVSVDRAGDVRQGAWTPVGSTSWRIFLDSSSLELFCGEGEVVFSSRVYPSAEWQVTNLGSQNLTVTAYGLSKSVP